MERLKGHVIREFSLSDDGMSLVVVSDTHRFIYQTKGDCCAHAYLEPPDREDVRSIIGQTVIDVISSGVKSEDHEYGVMDTEFYSIKTQFADLDLELRTEHNGYYGGWINLIREETL